MVLRACNLACMYSYPDTSRSPQPTYRTDTQLTYTMQLLHTLEDEEQSCEPSQPRRRLDLSKRKSKRRAPGRGARARLSLRKEQKRFFSFRLLDARWRLGQNVSVTPGYPNA